MSCSFRDYIIYEILRQLYIYSGTLEPQELTKKYFNKNSSNEKHVIFSNYLIKNPFIPQTQREIILKNPKIITISEISINENSIKENS